MNEELALLRRIAANPYDDAPRGAYADWLLEHDREAESLQVRATLPAKPSDSNWLTNRELIALLLTFPLDAVPLVNGGCSDEVPVENVLFHSAEEQKYVYREQQGFVSYESRWYASDAEVAKQFGISEAQVRANANYYNPLKGQKPDFRAVIRI